MLEVRNLRKVYKSKNGVNVNALDGVTLSFPETGMVFLLGKSGSGKSTLLNVCGGLDSPTEGEIIVKGRSSKDFSQSDFDSYRNTFVGFIFQEYNILNEFSVEDNIALALELQGKPKDKAAINKLLEEVDLQGFAKRKPNTLSGGQKQRIAIARALIKAPEIIMADEPTGALDSNTGKQVFDTLKKLSRDKLVLVVSHDRDFAEQYGDRIIELKDGQVLSDVSKTELAQQPLTANVNTLGDILCIKSGAALTEQDFASIKAFLSKADENVIIAKNEKDVENFKRVSRISDSGTKDVFSDTQTAGEGKTYSKEESRFIRSKLPIRHAIKIGVSGLKSKPVRLFFTVLLCTVAFVLFGLLSTLNFYDSETTFRETMADASISIMKLQKEYEATVAWYSNGEKNYEFTTAYETAFTDAELKAFAGRLSKDAFGAVRTMANFNLRQVETEFWVNEIAAFAVLPEENTLRQAINGQYPEKNDEIVISSYMAQMLQACNAYDSTGASLDLNTPEEIIGKELTISGKTYKVTGILNSGEIDAKYTAIKDMQDPSLSLMMNYYAYLADSLHQLAFVSEERLTAMVSENYYYKEGITNYTYAVAALNNKGEYVFPEWSNVTYSNMAEEGTQTVVKSLADNKTQPADGEAMISSSIFTSLLMEHYNKLAEEANNKENYTQAEKYYKALDDIYKLDMGGYYERDEAAGKDEFIAYTQQQMSDTLDKVIKTAQENNVSLTVGLKRFDHNNQTAVGDVVELKAVAVYMPNSSQRETKVIMSQNDFDQLWNEHKLELTDYSEMFTTYKEAPDAVLTTIYLPYTYTVEAVNVYWDMYSNNEFAEDGSRVYVSSSFVQTIRSVDEMARSLSKVFLYIGLVMAVFAALLFSNFISVSISQKKRDIGILRAVGARGTDVFKIFFSESFVIAAICVALSAVGSAVICGMLNTWLAAELGAALFVFGPASFLILVAIAMLTAIVATFLPVHNAAKKKPVDSIRAL